MTSYQYDFDFVYWATTLTAGSWVLMEKPYSNSNSNSNRAEYLTPDSQRLASRQC